MATLKEFEDVLRQRGMTTALAILDELRQRDRATRRAAPARRVTGRKMTPDLARRILELHGSTAMTQQEIAFQLGINQGRVNEVIKRGKWLDGNASSPEAQARDRALRHARSSAKPANPVPPAKPVQPVKAVQPAKPVLPTQPREVVTLRSKPPLPVLTPPDPRPGAASRQLSFGDL